MVFNPHYWLTIPLISIAVFPGAALAQLTPDASLGSESTLVTPDVLVQGTPADLVEGGAIRGENLFHSFSDFNVETLQRIYFANPAGIETILTRITGGNASNIDGLLGVDGLADLYLLNPNGIAFGPNAQLDIRGSFFVSTADGWELNNGEVFSAVNPEAPPILAVTLTPGLQYGATQQADVSNAGNLTLAPGESLVLLGNTVTSTGTLTAPGGQVQLLGNRVGLLDEGRIDVSAPTGGGTVNLGGDFQGQGILPTSAQTVVGPNAVLIADATETGTGGNIIVWSDGITRFGGLAQANGGTIGGDGGFIEISGADSLVFDGVVSTAAPRGNRGTVLFDPTNIVVVEDALAETTDLSTVDDPFDPDIGGDGDTRLAASALANAVANSNVSLQATNDIRFEAALNIANPGVTLTAIAGNDIQVSNNILFPAGGDVIFEAGNTVEFAGTDAVLETRGGDISIATNQLLMANDAQISASTFGIGDGGVIEINATDRIQLDSSDIYSSASAGDGNAGEIQIFTRQLFMRDGAQVGTGTFSSGDGGLLTVNATDQIQLSGASTGLFGQAASGSSGNAGDVNIVTNQLLIQDDADVSVATFGSGNGGNLKVNADDLIQLNGNGTLLTGRAGSGSSGNAGVIEILANRLLIQDDAQVDVTTFGEGDGGTLTVEVADVIKISGESRLTGLFSRAASSSLGDAGDIQVTADQISIQNGAIASGSGGLGSGGDIAIQANRIEVIGADSGISSTSNNSLSTASIGNVLLDVDEILLRDGGTVNARSLGAADAGNIEIVNASSVQLSGAGTGLRASANNVTADATAGLIRIDADTILVQDEAQLNVSSFGGGDAGAIEIVDASYVEFRNQNDESSTTEFTGAFVTTGLGTGNGGRVSIDADRLNFSGVFTGIQVDGTAVSNSGVVEITSSEVTLENEANILSLGALGRIQIVAEDFLEITDAAIALETLTADNPGVISLDVGDLRMSDFGYISAGIGFTALNSEAVEEAFGIDISDVLAVLAAFSELNPDSISSGGQIDVSADNVLLENQSQIISFGGDVDISSNTVSLRNESAVNVLSPLASGGRISVQADEALNLQNQSAILASAGPLGEEDGRGGAVSLDAPNITLSDQSFIAASAFSGGGGNVNIQADNFLLLRLNSLISASTGIAGNDGGDGGNVTIASPFVLGVLSENSDIIANAVAGDGGLVTITALDIIGLEFQDQLTPFSDITASSDLGLAGITEFNRLTDINVEEGLNELPVDLVDPNDLVSQQCALQASDRASEFTVVGRGGLPPDPSQPGTAGLFLEDLGTVLPDVTPVLDEARSNAPDELEPLTTIQEAQGWLQDVDGRIYLISATDDDSLAVPPAAVFCSNRPHA